MIRVLVLILAAPLAGCAGSVVGDALAGPEKLAQQDDSYCRSIGLQFGTADYATCRQQATNNREARHAHRLGVAATGLQIAVQPPPQTSTTTRCQKIGVEMVCNTQ